MKRAFTLIEVLIATVILALAAGVLINMLASASLQTQEAEAEWGRQHLLAIATEYFLLAGPKSSPPAELLPTGYSCSCSLEVKERLPDLNIALVNYQVTLFNAQHHLGTRKVDLIIPIDQL